MAPRQSREKYRTARLAFEDGPADTFEGRRSPAPPDPATGRHPGSTGAACAILKQLCAHEGHRFWPDDLSLRATANLPVSKHLTDHYLLSLAMHRQGKLVTLDRHINASLISGGAGAYVVL